MIYVRLVGGLGNKLFQYACARALALRHGVEVVLDTRELARGAAHAVYGLDRFAISARIGAEGELPPARGQMIRYALWRAGGMRPRFLRERGLGVNPAVLEATDDSYLHGYFQSEGYFRDQEAVIRDDLRVLEAPEGENARWLERIAAEPRAVSLHVRRGDYVGSAKGAAVHGTCDAAYYARAVAAIREKAGIEPLLFVFSDDPVWARANLKPGAEMVVLDHNTASAAVEDLRLMGVCRHHIIANSSFSWWGAWRNPSPEKVVVAPLRWFADPGLDNPDICPTDWIRL
jgi:hypothetical protein